jgi:hypothetical protein
VDVTTVFLSAARWADVRPPLGAAPEPFHLSIDAPAKPGSCPPSLFSHSHQTRTTDTLAYLAARYPTTPPPPTTLTPAHTYAASLAPLHGAFCAALHATLAPFAPAPDALAAVAAARWPGFVLPLLDAHAASLAAAAGDEDADGDGEGATGDEALEPAPPAEDTRMRLLRLFTPSFAAALDALAAGASDAAGWAAADAAAADTHAVGSALAPSTTGADALRALPRLQRFVLLAAYLASTNPAKADARVLGRLADGRGRGRRRGGGGTGARRGRGGRGGANKVSVPGLESRLSFASGRYVLKRGCAAGLAEAPRPDAVPARPAARGAWRAARGARRGRARSWAARARRPAFTAGRRHRARAPTRRGVCCCARFLSPRCAKGRDLTRDVRRLRSSRARACSSARRRRSGSTARRRSVRQSRMRMRLSSPRNSRSLCMSCSGRLRDACAPTGLALITLILSIDQKALLLHFESCDLKIHMSHMEPSDRSRPLIYMCVHR